MWAIKEGDICDKYKMEQEPNPLSRHGLKAYTDISVHDTCSYNVQCTMCVVFNNLLAEETKRTLAPSTISCVNARIMILYGTYGLGKTYYVSGFECIMLEIIVKPLEGHKPY